MTTTTHRNRLLPANTKRIRKVIHDVVRTADAPPSVTEFRIEGVRGLVLHVLPSGTATWYFHYDVGGGSLRKRRKLKLGRIDDLSLGRATNEAERLRVEVQQGADPVADKTGSCQALTFRGLAAIRLEKGDPLRPATRSDYEYVLRKDILPWLGELAVAAITRANVIAVLDRITDRGSKRRADTARAVISSIYSFGLDRGLVQHNPASGLRNRHDNQPRDVIADSDVIRRLWAAMDAGEAAMSPQIILITKLVLLTGQRRTEIAASRRDQLELGSLAPLFTIPRGMAKNRNAHRVPLSPQAVALFRNALDMSGDSEFVFAAGQTSSHIAPRSVSKAMERTRIRLGIADITMHDLRRTAGTFMSQFGVPKDIRERILNHGGTRKGSITDGVYNRYEYDAEKRAALELWADAVYAMTGSSPCEIDGYHIRLARLNLGAKIKVA